MRGDERVEAERQRAVALVEEGEGALRRSQEARQARVGRGRPAQLDRVGGRVVGERPDRRRDPEAGVVRERRRCPG